jgi:hypothetical protein
MRQRPNLQRGPNRVNNQSMSLFPNGEIHTTLMAYQQMESWYEPKVFTNEKYNVIRIIVSPRTK